MFNGKIRYFDWAIFNSYVKLPEEHQPDPSWVMGNAFWIFVGDIMEIWGYSVDSMDSSSMDF